MDVFECIHGRRSVRKFLDIPVEWEKVGVILDAGVAAPSSGNLQNWKLIVVQDENKKKALADAALQQYWISTAPAIIVICAELRRIKQFYGVRGERLYSIQNCAAVAENMLLAAHALGLASCWVGAFDEDMVARTLSIPDDAEIRPQIMLPIGYPDETPAKPQKYPLDNITYFERWSRQNIGKIKDVNSVLWNYRVAEKGLKAAKGTAKALGRMARRSGLIEKVKRKFRK